MPAAFPLQLPDFLEDADDEIRVVGHRVNLYHVLTKFNEGLSPEEIVLQLPTLKTSTVYKIVGYYLDHQPEIDRYLAEYRKELDEQAARAQPGGGGPTKAELLRRLEQIRLKANNALEVSY
jgi:uncharacterized protein (DUF433 family)